MAAKEGRDGRTVQGADDALEYRPPDLWGWLADLPGKEFESDGGVEGGADVDCDVWYCLGRSRGEVVDLLEVVLSEPGGRLYLEAEE